MPKQRFSSSGSVYHKAIDFAKDEEYLDSLQAAAEIIEEGDGEQDDETAEKN